MKSQSFCEKTLLFVQANQNTLRKLFRFVRNHHKAWTH